jgi:hypothetical protein
MYKEGCDCWGTPLEVLISNWQSVKDGWWCQASLVLQPWNIYCSQGWFTGSASFGSGGNIIPVMFLRLQIRKAPSRFGSLKLRDLLMLPNLFLKVGRKYSRLWSRKRYLSDYFSLTCGFYNLESLIEWENHSPCWTLVPRFQTLVLLAALSAGLIDLYKEKIINYLESEGPCFDLLLGMFYSWQRAESLTTDDALTADENLTAILV